MRVLIVSDTHKKHENLKEIIQRVGKFDLMIHLGDAEGCEDDIRGWVDCPLEIVAGNNDFFSDLEREKELKIGKYNILITHGHYYYVVMGIEDIRKEAMGRGMDVVMFGHTHRPLLDCHKGVIALNPGSVSYPRQEGHKPSYALMDIDDMGEAHFSIGYLE